MAIGDRVALSAHHHPGSDRVSERLYCKGVVLVEERGHSPPPPPFPLTVRVLLSSRSAGIASPPFPCTLRVLLSSRSADIAPPPPQPNFCWGSGNLSFFNVVCTWPAIPRDLSLFYVRWWWRLLGRLYFRWELAQCLCYRC